MELTRALSRAAGNITAAAFLLLLNHVDAAAARDTVPLDPSPPSLSSQDRALAERWDEPPTSPADREAMLVEVMSRHDGDFPLVDNTFVRQAFRALTGSSAARRNMRYVLDRHAQMADTVDRALAVAGLPLELAALPVLESGYTNVHVDSPGAPQGLWALMAPTARNFGLRVDDGGDERFDPERSTEAAVRYLRVLHDRFGDWTLTMAAYNQGGGSVEAAMKSHNTRDPWELMRSVGVKDYAARAIAVAFVLDDPTLVAEAEPAKTD